MWSDFGAIKDLDDISTQNRSKRGWLFGKWVPDTNTAYAGSAPKSGYENNPTPPLASNSYGRQQQPEYGSSYDNTAAVVSPQEVVQQQCMQF
jgi:hypothetical protein